MKNRNKIIILLVIAAVGVAGFYLYQYIMKKIRLKKEMETWNEEQKQDAIMRDKYEIINNVDEFIESVKYAKNKIIYGYDLRKIGKKQDVLSKMDFNYLKEIRDYIYEGITEIPEEDREKLLKFFQKLYA